MVRWGWELPHQKQNGESDYAASSIIASNPSIV